jgi:hypothetical protein
MRPMVKFKGVLTPTPRSGGGTMVPEAKRPETRERRLHATLERLRGQ